MSTLTALRLYWKDGGRSELARCSLGLALAGVLVYNLASGEAQDFLGIFHRFRWSIIPQNILALCFYGSIRRWSQRLCPRLAQWSWLSLCRRPAVNLNMIPLDIRGFGLAFGVLLIFSLPLLAFYEEYWFRFGTVGWSDGLWRSLLFGFVHCLAGVDLGTGFALSFAGLWFSRGYLAGGVMESTLHHACSNELVIGYLLFRRWQEHILEYRRVQTPWYLHR